MTILEPEHHESLRANLHEYALGTLDGRARSELAEHVRQCNECARELAYLNVAVDALLALPGGAEPPVGFESAVMERIRLARPRARPRIRPLAYAAAALVLIAGVVGWVVEGRNSPSRSTPVMAERALVANGHRVGAVYVYTGTPTWMFVNVDDASAPSTIRCIVITSSNARRTIGTYDLVAGRGGWGTSVPVAFSKIRGLELTSTSGTVIARLADATWTRTSSGAQPW